MCVTNSVSGGKFFVVSEEAFLLRAGGRALAKLVLEAPSLATVLLLQMLVGRFLGRKQ